MRDKKTDTVHPYEWDNGLPLNEANLALRVIHVFSEPKTLF